MPNADPKRRSQRRNRDADVIAAAIEVFHRKGYAAASVQDVADRVGVLKGSLYHYIDSKEDLLFRIFDESHRQASEIVESVAAREVTAIERLREYFERYICWYLENVERVSIYFTEWRYLTGQRRETVIKQRRVYERFVAGLIDEAKHDGAVPSGSPTKYAAFFALGAAASVPTWYRQHGTDSPEEIAAVYAGMIVAALTGAAASAS